MGEKFSKDNPPRSSEDFNRALKRPKSGETVNYHQSGSHGTYEWEAPDGHKENFTIIQGGRDLKDTNPKVWHRLVKALTTAGIITFILSQASSHPEEVHQAIEAVSRTFSP